MPMKRQKFSFHEPVISNSTIFAEPWLQVQEMPLSNYSEESFESNNDSCSDASGSDLYSTRSDLDISTSSRTTLSDQTLLRQAFGGAVHGRKVVAREWRTEREQDISVAVRIAEANEAAATPKKSYSSRVRSLMRKLRLTGK